MDPSVEVTSLIRRWERAIQAGDMEGIIADHGEDIVMFDVPEPLQSLGLEAYRKTWDLFYAYDDRRPISSSSRICG
jgi:ketosteroid isomerase-like protein